MIKQNVIKGWITTIVGTATMVVTLVLVFTKAIDFVWEGTAGLIVGCLLLMAPKTIEKKVSDAIRYVGGRGSVSPTSEDQDLPLDKPQD